MFKNCILENANLRKLEAWVDFYIPDKEDLNNLKLDDIVKLIFISSKWENERMWVQIKKVIDNDYFLWNLVNKPHNIKTLNYWDVIRFWKENIIDIYNN